MPRLARLVAILATTVLACGGRRASPAPVVSADNHVEPPRQWPDLDVRNLVDAGAYDAIPRATRVRASSALRLTEVVRAAPETPEMVDTSDMRERWWPVIAERERVVRLAYRDDEVVVAAWIARTSLATSVIAPTELRQGGRPIEVTLGVGAEVEPGPGTGQATLVHDLVEAVGEVAAGALGDVFDRPRAVAPGHDATIIAAAGAEVWSAATSSAGQASIARLRAGAPVRVLGREPGPAGRREVRYADGLVEVRGFVDGAALDRGWRTLGGGGGHGIGASHAEMLPTPAGTCLYAPATDDIVGVTVTDSTRYAYDTTDPTWWTVLVWTPWGIERLRVEDTAAAGSVEGVRPRSCLRR